MTGKANLLLTAVLVGVVASSWVPHDVTNWELTPRGVRRAAAADDLAAEDLGGDISDNAVRPVRDTESPESPASPIVVTTPETPAARDSDPQQDPPQEAVEERAAASEVTEGADQPAAEEIAEVLVVAENSKAEVQAKPTPESDSKSSPPRGDERAAATAAAETIEPLESTTFKPSNEEEKPTKLSAKLLDFLKNSKPRGKKGVLSSVVDQATKKSQEVFGARNKPRDEDPEPVTALPSSPRAARFFASASSMLSGFVPAMGPPRQGRSACAQPGACHTPGVMALVMAAQRVVEAPEPRPADVVLPASATETIRRGSPRRRPSLPLSTTERPSTSPPPVPTRPVILARQSARRRTPTPAPTPPPTPIPGESSDLEKTSAPLTSSSPSRVQSFRRFKVLEAKTTTTTEPSELAPRVVPARMLNTPMRRLGDVGPGHRYID